MLHLFVALLLCSAYVTVADDQCSDSLQKRYSPLFDVSQQNQGNYGQDGPPYWFLIWGWVGKQYSPQAWSSTYEVEVDCYVSIPRALDGKTGKVASYVNISNTPTDCFSPPMLTNAIFLATGYSSDYFVMRVEPIVTGITNDMPWAIAWWLTVTNLCPTWRLPGHGRKCPNMDPIVHQKYTVPPGCLIDVSVDYTNQVNADHFLWERWMRCKDLGATQNSMQAQVQGTNVTWSIWGKHVATNYSTWNFDFESSCLISSSTEDSPKQHFTGKIATEDNGCYPFDMQSASQQLSYVIFTDQANRIRSTSIESNHSQYQVLASVCSANKNTPIDDSASCQPLVKSTSHICYPDVSITEAIDNVKPVSPLQCLEWPCSNFTEVYKIADQIIWGTVLKIEPSKLNPSEIDIEIMPNCRMKSKKLYDYSMSLHVTLTELTYLSQPIIVMKDYIVAVKIRRIFNLTIPELEVIGIQLEATRQNWLDMCSNCESNDLPTYEPFIEPIGFFQDYCSVEACYKPDHNVQSSSKCTSGMLNLTSLTCQGLSNSLETRFNTSSIAIYGQFQSLKPSPFKAVEYIVTPEMKIRQISEQDRYWFAMVDPLCQLTGKSSDLGPTIGGITITFDAAGCSFEKYVKDLEPGGRYLFFLDAQTGTVSAVPIRSTPDDHLLEILSYSCSISPPEFPIVARGRSRKYDVEELKYKCPIIRHELCIADLDLTGLYNASVRINEASPLSDESSEWTNIIIISLGSIGCLFIITVLVSSIIRKRKSTSSERCPANNETFSRNLLTETTPLINSSDRISNY